MVRRNCASQIIPTVQYLQITIYISDHVFFLIILNYKIIRNLDSYLSYCFNLALYIYVYLDVYGNHGVMLLGHMATSL